MRSVMAFLAGVNLMGAVGAAGKLARGQDGYLAAVAEGWSPPWQVANLTISGMATVFIVTALTLGAWK